MMKYVALISIAILASCQAPVKTSEAISDHELLSQIYESDQEARRNLSMGGQMTPEEFAAFARGDSVRRVQVDSLVALGEPQTANDFFHVAMVYQHGSDSLSYKLAHEMSAKAVALDSTLTSAKWLTAASWDRYLLSIGQPQWYGTQYAYTQEAGEYFLSEIDTTKVDDAERIRLGIPTLREAYAQADSFNAEMARELEKAQ